MKEKKGLQKFTETEKKINLLMQNDKISQTEVDKHFSKAEKESLCEYIGDKLIQLKGNEKDVFIEKVSDLLPKTVKNQIWENNHYVIIQAISKIIEDTGKMPPKNSIAAETGLSRQTIIKHLREFNTNTLYEDQKQQFRIMYDRVLAKVLRMAVQGAGDVKAARLYFEVMTNMNGQASINTKINNQNNYIQINGTVLSQDVVKCLNQEQLQMIENILKTGLPHSRIDN